MSGLSARSPGLLRALLQEAIDNMLSVWRRTLLSLLGIGIGAAAVVALLNIGENTSEEAARQFRLMGADLIVVQDSPAIGGQRKARALVRADASALMTRLAAVSLSAPVSSSAVRAGAGAGASNVMALGATDDMQAVARLQLEQGRFVSDRDGYSTVVVVGSHLAKTLKADGTGLRLGDMIRVDNYLYTVIGILRSTPRNPLLPFDIDNALIVPIKADRRMSSSTGSLSNILVRIREGHDPVQALADIARYFQESGTNTQVQGALQLIDGMRQQGQLFKWMLGGVACISLLVGGIGIMNAMLAGITERRREIGLRLAIGADRMGIMTMIIAESVVLSLAGGGAGTVLGLFISMLFARLSGWEPTLSCLAAALGFGMSLATGLFFGIYPARKASALSPIEALRAD